LLVCNTARGLASGLARGLALAAATVLNGLCNVLGFDSFDSLHSKTLHVDINITYSIILSQKNPYVNIFCGI
jgi:hypothetical protein